MDLHLTVGDLTGEGFVILQDDSRVVCQVRTSRVAVEDEEEEEEEEELKELKELKELLLKELQQKRQQKNKPLQKNILKKHSIYMGCFFYFYGS